MFNSALIYELAVLKPYAEAILFGIPKDAPEYIEAKRLLKFSDIPVAEIGRQMGFSDAGYFSTVFRRHEKISPAEYRKRNREFYTNKT